MARPTVFGIPAPWSGDPGSGDGSDGRKPRPRLYTIWWWVYRAARVVKHRLGRHDWRTMQHHPASINHWQRCDWCGATRMAPLKLDWRGRLLVALPFLILVVGMVIIGLKNGWS